jgi:RHS repeat-associated protein
VVVTRAPGEAEQVAYLLTEALGSVDVVTGGKGAVVQRRSYDAFGAKRNPAWGQGGGFASLVTPMGFTGQEGDDELGLVNMRGRIYDPQVARFLTTDPLVSEPGYSQSWNPYSYVHNSPLAFVDPTGFDPDDPSMPKGCDVKICLKAPDGKWVTNQKVTRYEHDSSGTPQRVVETHQVQVKDGGGDDGKNVVSSLPEGARGATVVDRNSDKFHPYSPEGWAHRALFGASPPIKDPLDTENGRAIGKFAASLTPGLNSWMTFNDPKATPLQKVAAVGSDLATLAVVGGVFKAGTKAIGVVAEAAAGAGHVAEAVNIAPRALVAADLGLEGTTAIVEGTFAIKKGQAIVKVSYLGDPSKKLLKHVFTVLDKLKEAARAEGATSLRIETTPVIEETGFLRKFLTRSGFASRTNGTMFFTSDL